MVRTKAKKKVAPRCYCYEIGVCHPLLWSVAYKGKAAARIREWEHGDRAGTHHPICTFHPWRKKMDALAKTAT